MIDIKNIDGSVLFSVLPDENAVFHEELMASDYVKLSWDSDVYKVIPAGAYIEYEGEKYKLLGNYSPTQQDECTYQYTPQFQSRVMNWEKQITPVYTYEEDGTTVKSREMDWEFTGSPADAMYIVKQAIKNETGEDWTIQLAESLPATITISSQSASIFATLNTIAGECDTEWWADKKTNTLYLSKCIFGDAVKLEVGDNVQVPTVTNDSEGYFTRFYAFGSTRNITQDYDGGQATNSIVNKRLTLNPTKYPNGYKDIKEGLKPEEVFVKVLYFDEIYPSSKLTISDVRARLKYRLDNNGQKIRIGGTDEEPIYEQYAIWYFQIAGFTFDESSIIEGLNLSASFESGQLAGRDFELTYHKTASTVNDAADVTAFNIKAGDYEIIIDESSGTIIPGTSYIIPQDGDSLVLFNIVMPDEYVTSAQDELEKALDKAMLSYTEDNNSYQMASDPTRFYAQGTDIQMGQAVTYVNGEKTLSTRVQMVEKRLDLPCYQTIKVGNKIIKGNTQQLKDEVANVNQNIDVIQAFNELSASLSQSYANAQREMIEGFASIRNMWRFDPDRKDTIYSIYNVYSEKGLASKGWIDAEGGGGTGGATTLGQLVNVGSWADEVPNYDRVMVQIAGQTKWTEKKLSEIVGLDETALANYLTINNYAKKSDIPPLDGYATITDLDSRIDELVNGAPAAYDTLKEIADVLQGNVDSIGDIITTLGTKADKTITINAGTGLTGGGNLSANRTLSLSTVGTAGTYTKVTVDAYGRVTGHSSLVAADIPTLAISKISGLQSSLDSKLNASVFNELFEKVELSNGTFAIRAKYGLYSDDFISAKGQNTGSGSGSDVSYSRLDSWADYTTDKSGYVLSAGLGWDLNTRVESLEGGSALTVSTTGTGNVITSITKSGTKITATKGITALTSVSLATISDLHSSWDAVLKATKPTTLAGYGITDAYTKTDSDSRYVNVSGDSMTGQLNLQVNGTVPLNINNTNESQESCLRVQSGGVSKSAFGWANVYGTYMYDYTSRKYLYILNGILRYDGNQVLDTSNYSTTLDTRYVKKAGDTMTGTLYMPHTLVGISEADANKYAGSNAYYNLAVGWKKPHYGLSILLYRPDSTKQAGIGWSTTSADHAGISLNANSNDLSITNLKGGIIISGLKNNVYPLILKGANKYSVINFKNDVGTDVTDVGWLNDTRGNCSYIANINTNSCFSISNDGIWYTDNNTIFKKYKVWHAGNDGSGSGLNADLLDGYHIKNIQTGGWISLTPYIYDATNGIRWYWYKIATISDDSPVFHKIEIDAKGDSNYPHAARCTLYLSNYNSGVTKSVTISEAESNSNYGKINVCMDTSGNVYIQAFNISWTSYLRYRILYGSYGTVYESPTRTETKPANTSTAITNGGIKLNTAKAFEYTDNYLQGISLKALKLNTTRTIWGQSFDGTKNVSGALTGVSSINFTSTGCFNLNHFGNFQPTTNTDSNYWNVRNYAGLEVFRVYASSGNVYIDKNLGIGTTSPSYKLHVAGTMGVTGAVTMSSTLNVAGTIHSLTGIYTEGYMTAKTTSDIRLKTILNKVDYQQKLLDLGSIVNFKYNDIALKRNKGAVDDKEHIGLIYQNAVKSNLVNFCHKDNDGFGSINYIASDYINLIAGACQLNILGLRTLSKKTETLEQRVARLEKENIELKQKLNAYEKSNSMVS